MGAADVVGFDLVEGDGIGIDIGFEVVDFFDVGEDFEGGGEVSGEDFMGDGGGGDAADGFAGGGASAALPIADAVFGVVGVVGVGRTVFVLHLGVCFGAVVFIVDEDGDGGAEGEVFEGAGEDLAGIGFFARGGDIGLAGFPAVEGGLDIGFGEGEVGGAAVDDDADGAAVGFAEGGDAEEMAGDGGHGVGPQITLICADLLLFWRCPGGGGAGSREETIVWGV